MEFTQEQLDILAKAFQDITQTQAPVAPVPTGDTEPVMEGGRTRWEGILTILGTQAGNLDTRLLKTVTWADLPLTLYAQTTNASGHDGAEIVGNIDTIWIDGNNVMASGLFEDSEDADEIIELVENGSLTGISVDLRDGIVELQDLPDGTMQQVWVEARIGAATLVGLPAFENARIALKKVPAMATASAVGVGPHIYPAKFFDKIKFSKATRLTITPEGEVFGHVVMWGRKHRAPGHETWTAKPSRQKDMPDFNIGETHLDDGRIIATGIFTSEGLHAPMHDSDWDKKTISRFVQGFRDKMMGNHYMEDVGLQFAQVVGWEDEYGVAVHGSLQPWVTSEQATRAMAGCTSIDTRYGAVAGVHFVNVCGFVPPPITEEDKYGNVARMVASMASNEEEGCADCEKEAAEQAKASTPKIVDLNAVKALDDSFAKAEMASILAKSKHNS